MISDQAPERDLALRLEYEGTDFLGWQKQPGVRTVEGEVICALEEVLGREVTLTTAARTDTGVHALGQVVNFSACTGLSEDELKAALNGVLPPDVRILGVAGVGSGFNARFDARSRTYQYVVATRPSVFLRRRAYVPKMRVDFDRAQEGAQLLVGEQDFTSFCKTASSGKDCVLRVLSARWLETRFPQVRVFEIEATRFLHHMVRVVVGTLLEIGSGRWEPCRVSEILAGSDRRLAGPTVPGHGLWLVRVTYDEDPFEGNEDDSTRTNRALLPFAF